MKNKINKLIKDWGFLFFISIVTICSTGAMANYYDIDGDCQNIANLVEIQNPIESTINKYIEKSIRVILASVSNIVPVFSFDRIYSAECEINKINVEMVKAEITSEK